MHVLALLAIIAGALVTVPIPGGRGQVWNATC